MTYDCRSPDRGRDPAAVCFPGAVKIVDPQTGERIPYVVWCDTKGRLLRFVCDAFGQPMVGADRKSRLEMLEIRPWKAVHPQTGEVVAQSENAL